MRLLICTDGSRHAEQAGEFGALLARAARAEVTLLGVVENGSAEARVQEALQRLRERLGEGQPPAMTQVRRGHADEQILDESEESRYDLVVIGSRGRRGLTRFLLGSTAATLARYMRTPLLIVKGERREIRRVLICTGAEALAEVNARVGGEIAASAGAAVTIVHVMSQVPLGLEAKVAELGEPAERAIAAGTREGRHLQRNIDILREVGVTAPVSPKIRYGLVIEELLGEIRAGDYDLVVIGAHRAPRATSWPELRELLIDDVADQILSHCDRPVLVVRGNES